MSSSDRKAILSCPFAVESLKEASKREEALVLLRPE
jgi:hypothetical protein